MPDVCPITLLQNDIVQCTVDCGEKSNKYCPRTYVTYGVHCCDIQPIDSKYIYMVCQYNNISINLCQFNILTRVNLRLCSPQRYSVDSKYVVSIYFCQYNNTRSLGASYTCMYDACLLYTSPSPRDRTRSRMPSSA